MLSLVINISKEQACIVDGDEASFISANYRLFPDCITIEVMGSVNGEVKQFLNKDLSDDENVTIHLEESEKEAVVGNAKLSIPVKRYGRRCESINVFKNSDLVFSKNIGRSGYCDLGVVVNNSDSIYRINILHGDNINQAEYLKSIDLSSGDVILIETAAHRLVEARTPTTHKSKQNESKTMKPNPQPDKQ